MGRICPLPCSSIYSASKYLLTAYYTAGTALSDENTIVNKTKSLLNRANALAWGVRVPDRPKKKNTMK